MYIVSCFRLWSISIYVIGGIREGRVSFFFHTYSPVFQKDPVSLLNCFLPLLISLPEGLLFWEHAICLANLIRNRINVGLTVPKNVPETTWVVTKPRRPSFLSDHCDCELILSLPLPTSTSIGWELHCRQAENTDFTPLLPTAPAEGCPRGQSQHQLLIIITQQPDAETELQVRVDEAGTPHLYPVPIHSLQGLSWLWHLWESCKPWFAFSWPVAIWILKAPPPPNRGYRSLSTLLASTEHSASKVRVSHHLYSWPQHLDSHLAWGETQKICKMNSSEKPPEVRKKSQTLSLEIIPSRELKFVGLVYITVRESKCCWK